MSVNSVFKFKKSIEKLLLSVNEGNVIIFDPRNDDRLEPNYTVNCFFSGKDLKRVVNLITKIKEIDHNQLFYKTPQLHITLLGQINLSSNEAEIITKVQEFLATNKIEFHLLGVGSNRKVSSVTAFPVDFDIAKLRATLRRIGGGTTFDGDYENLGWINFMRFLHKPNKRLFPALRKEIYAELGTVRPNSIVLMKNSSRLLNGAEVLHSFEIQ